MTREISSQRSIANKADEMPTPCKRVVMITVVLVSASLLLALLAASARASFGFVPGSVEFSFTEQSGVPDTEAGSHPYQLTTAFALNETTNEQGRQTTDGDIRDLHTILPPGLIGNPTAVPTCDAADFFTPTGAQGSKAYDVICPKDTQIGTVNLNIFINGTGHFPQLIVPVYNLAPRFGAPAEFGFNVLGFSPVRLVPRVRTGADYGITVDSLQTSQSATLFGVKVTFWGVPWASSHNVERGQTCLQTGVAFPLTCEGGGIAVTGTPKPFLSLPTACGVPLPTTLEANSWQDPTGFIRETVLSRNAAGEPAGMEGCARPDFTPTISVVPESSAASTPTGLAVDLHVPQNESPTAFTAADLKDAVVTLPEGISVNPASANGLAACTSAQIELHGPEPARCPDAAEIGTVEVDTPLLDHPLPGAVYVAEPLDNPFGSLLAIYIAIDDPQSGIVVKLAGHVEADPRTGRLTTAFDENPQLPFEDFKLDFFGGPRAALVTPTTCGKFTSTTDLTPWTSPEGQAARPTDSFLIGSGANGGGCVSSESQMPSQPAFQAGTVFPIAASFSPFVVRLSREDGSQRLSGLNLTLPEGLVGRLLGTPYCPDSAIAQAEARDRPGEGATEQSRPSCPAASQVGTVDVAAGAGPQPYHVSGRAYLAGPYKGAMLSLVVITPAVAGPYDLGAVVVRTPLYVNEETAQVSAKSDPLPTILEGIPLDIRSVAIQLNKPEFTYTPSSCEEMAVTGEALTTAGPAALLHNRFQVGGCKGLDFKPKLALRVFGKTNRNAKPRFRAVLQAKPGEANIARAQVNLPHSLFLEQNHIKTVCTRVQWNEGAGHGSACPQGSIYGHARAITPLLEKPLEGPVYLRSNGGERKLPDLVAALNGQVDIALWGKVDSGKNHGLRTTFEVVPDAPVSKFILEMKGGKKGLLVNSENLCAPQAKTHAIVRFVGHNGKVEDFKPKVRSACKKRRARYHRAHRLRVRP